MDVRAYAAIEQLKSIPLGEFWYVASPYSGYKGDLWEANRLACRTTAYLARYEVPAFSPIAHSHALCQHYPVSPMDHGLWMGLDRPMMMAAYGCIVVTMPGWQTSKGVGEEIDYFENTGKPVLYIQPVEGL